MKQSNVSQAKHQYCDFLRISFFEQTTHLRSGFAFDNIAGIKLGKCFSMRCIDFAVEFAVGQPAFEICVC